jgi:modulator of drug activity B
MKRALIINAHQTVEGFSSGRLNRTLVDAIAAELAQRGYEVRHTAIERGYDVNEEVDKHAWADLIVLQTPVFWFGCPWPYKKYVDEVFTTGLVQQKLVADDGRTRSDPAKQYGSGGKMQGKRYLLSTTWNAPRAAFGDKSQKLFQGMTVDEAFASNTANYRFCGAEILPGFSCHDVIKQADVEGDLARLRAHLAKVL